MSFSPSRTTTAPPCGAGSSTQSASSPTRSRLAGPTDYLESHSAVGSTHPATFPLRRSILDNEERFSLTGADPGCGALALRLVRRAAKRKTLFVITYKRLAKYSSMCYSLSIGTWRAYFQNQMAGSARPASAHRRRQFEGGDRARRPRSD